MMTKGLNIEKELISDGVLPADYQNVKRLTPEVYCYREGENQNWIIKSTWPKFKRLQKYFRLIL
jgi:hypothetical protein